MQHKTILVILLFCVSFSHAQLSADTVAMLDKIINRYAENGPGAQVAVSRNGQIIYSNVRGLADLEHNVSLTKASKTEAGSVSKQFTAAAILLLQQQGKLSLSDDVRKYIPELPNYGHVITIRHLMQHTSGLKDWGSIAEISGWPRGTKAYTNDDALAIIIRQKTLNNKPGDEYIYSNSGYTLMTHVVQRVSGMSHADFTKKYLFEPAGMTNTEWRDDYRRVVLNRAIAYSRSGGKYITNMPFESTYGHGGLLTTAEDLLKWNEFYLSQKLGGASLLKAQTATTPLSNGRRNNYAAGLTTDSVLGWAAIAHSGATASYRANLEYFPQLGLSIAWLSNTSIADMSDVPSAVRNVFVRNLSQSNNTTAATTTNIDLKDFIPFTGAYSEVKTGTGFKFFIRDTVLMSEPNGRVMPLSSNSASVGRAKLIFSRSPRQLQFITAAGDTLSYVGVDSARTTPAYLSEYAGLYTSEETESKLRIVAKDGKLYYRQRGDDVLLTPLYKDGFSFPAGSLSFERKNGKINKMYISISRARKVEFNKMSK